MGFLGGTALKLFQTVIYALTFCSAGVILGIYSYFLAWMSHENRSIPTWTKAVEGLSGAAALYLIFAVLLTCFLGGKSFFAFIGIFLDILFTGAFIAIAVMTRDGTRTCSRNSFVRTPVGNGRGSTDLDDGPSLSFMCRLNKAAFAVSIIGAGLFLISAFVQLWIARNHKKEKKYGPSPANNYTSGSGKRWFGRKRAPRTTHDAYAHKDAEAGVVGGGLAAPVAAHDTRPSHDTAYTGSTMGNANAYTTDKYAPVVPTHNGTTVPTHGGYHTAPSGTGVNPYGYDNAGRTANNF